MSVLIPTLTRATLELTNVDTATRNLSCVQNVVKDSSGCGKGNDTWRQTTAQRATRKTNLLRSNVLNFVILSYNKLYILPNIKDFIMRQHSVL